VCSAVVKLIASAPVFCTLNTILSAPVLLSETRSDSAKRWGQSALVASVESRPSCTKAQASEPPLSSSRHAWLECEAGPEAAAQRRTKLRAKPCWPRGPKSLNCGQQRGTPPRIAFGGLNTACDALEQCASEPGEGPHLLAQEQQLLTRRVAPGGDVRAVLKHLREAVTSCTEERSTE